MLFNSFEFLFGFLPVVFIVFFMMGRRSPLAAAGWLAFASLFFYGWWNPHFVALLMLSITGNYLTGRALSQRQHTPAGKRLLALAIAGNLLVLGVYKYSNFFISTLDQSLGAHLPALDIVLPLGISFFTFTQIAFLVDVYRGIATEFNFIHYTLFVTYFPHLIAGPVLHHKEMMPQFANRASYRIVPSNLAIGVLFLTIGLAKKILLADNLSPYVSPVFSAANDGVPLNLLAAWTGALAYTFQLYFDFSGYTDMAIGISRMFNIVLPLNFNSPYKSRNIVEFWRNWHMTLSRFLRDYLYIPLGGNRDGAVRRYQNLMITMVLGGLWHGANWTFVIWGALHGLFLCVNHAWRFVARGRVEGWETHRSYRVLSTVLTCLAVIVAWVFFRAPSFHAAFGVLGGMAGLHGITLPDQLQHIVTKLTHHHATFVQFAAPWQALVPYGMAEAKKCLLLLAVSALIVWACPNSQQIVARLTQPARALTFRPARTIALASGFACGATFIWCMLFLARKAEFLYFQF
ncbi:MBOAT family protein [Paraburkholderia sp. Tr-20389]|uniref:MBOAT family O-acyltransferase n=1 Tax=Paraburkholderia sp. Tr-20389 TaxID=2703903 RepID=UPI00197F389E|nr:MBOAT family protein [Paraburkholderia sp. Tr-20389]MBN3758312.1 MBOAT family protein [Paraburkholderia sp. Tr-20389]